MLNIVKLSSTIFLLNRNCVHVEGFGFNNCDDTSIIPSDLNQKSMIRSRLIPDKVIMGYTTSDARTQQSLDRVTRAVENGVNVLIWSFIAFQTNETTAIKCLKIQGGPDLSSVRLYQTVLQEMGYGDTLHLVSFGGWNGPHLNTDFTAEELYLAWKEYGGDVFDGFDWDLEGEDNIEGPGNYFTIDVLNRMGEMSELAKKDGYIVAMAPMESYLDIGKESFSRYVNLPYDDDWHPEFTYHGANVYAYILTKWQDSIDLISIQFYESYSHAAYSINHLGKSASDWLTEYLIYLKSNGEGFYVNFGTDHDVRLGRMFVNVPINKLVVGK